MINISIKGEKWKVFVFESEEFVNKFGEGMEGFTDTKRKQIFFDSEDLDQEVIRHELVHGYVSALRLEAASLTSDQLEEIYAELFAKDGPAIIKQASALFSKLRDLE